MADTPLETEKPENEPTPEACAEATEGETPIEFEAEAKDEMSALMEKLDALAEEANTHRDRALRAVAEMENFRRRSVREKDETRKFANQALLENFLPILDNFALGLDHARQHEGGKAFADGFAMILTQIENWLNGHGVERIAPLGEEFDANLHESVAPHPACRGARAPCG